MPSRATRGRNRFAACSQRPPDRDGSKSGSPNRRGSERWNLPNWFASYAENLRSMAWRLDTGPTRHGRQGSTSKTAGGMTAVAPGDSLGQRDEQSRAQKDGSSLNWPRSVPRSPLRLRSGRSGRAVAHRRLGATSSASISVTERLSPSGVSQVRVRSRPRTTARLPLARDSAMFSAWSRQALTRKKLVSPSRQVPSASRMRWLTARRKLVTGVPFWVKRSSGSSVRLPTWTVKLSLAIVVPPVLQRSRGCGAAGSAGRVALMPVAAAGLAGLAAVGVGVAAVQAAAPLPPRGRGAGWGGRGVGRVVDDGLVVDLAPHHPGMPAQRVAAALPRANRHGSRPLRVAEHPLQPI